MHVNAHAWRSITTRFRERPAIPRAVTNSGCLHLVGGPVVLTLGLPFGSTLESQVVDRAHARSAHLYSLVVNAAGEAYAEVLTIHDIDGQSIIQQAPCSIEVVHGNSTSIHRHRDEQPWTRQNRHVRCS